MIIMLSFTQQEYFGKKLKSNLEWNLLRKFRSKIGKRQYTCCVKKRLSLTFCDSNEEGI